MGLPRVACRFAFVMWGTRVPVGNLFPFGNKCATKYRNRLTRAVWFLIFKGCESLMHPSRVADWPTLGARRSS